MNRFKLYLKLMRFHRPLPILLLLWPVYIALAIAGQGSFDIRITLIFTLGGILMRAAGCVANDLADQQIDPHVARTANRPLASGAVSQKEAQMILGILLALAFICVLFLNAHTVMMSCCALALALFYPLTKRFFVLPQLILGLTYNFGVLMAFTAMDVPFTWISTALYLASVSWTLAYDTFYALCDRVEDEGLGIHSSALFFGSKVYTAIAFFQILMLGLFFLMGGHFEAGTLFYFCLIIAVGISLEQHRMSAVKKAHLQAFMINHWIGFFLFIGTESIFI
jgi:4-hydroxybenzoate polyprenyltransferase